MAVLKNKAPKSSEDQGKDDTAKPANGQERPDEHKAHHDKTKDNTAKPSESQAKDDADQLITYVEAGYIAALENGLFTKDQHYATRIGKYQVAISSANKAMKDGDYEKAKDEAGKAQEVLSELIQSRGFLWRLWNEYAFHWLIWLIAWTLILAWLGYTVYLTSPLTNPQVYTIFSTKLSLPITGPLRLLSMTALAGSIGAVLRGLFWVGFQVSRREYKRAWSTELFSSPFVGLLFGVFVYITVAAGLLATTQSTVPKSINFDLAAAFVVGFNWQTAENFLDRIGTGIFGNSK